MRFARAGVATMAVAFLVGVAFSVFHHSPARNLPVEIGVGHRGILAITAVMDASDVSPPLMVGANGDSAYYLGISRRGQSLGAELVRSQVPLGIGDAGINETVMTYTAALVSGRLVLHPQGQRVSSATTLSGRARGNALVITDPNDRRRELVLRPGSMNDFSKLEARLGARRTKLTTQA